MIGLLLPYDFEKGIETNMTNQTYDRTDVFLSPLAGDSFSVDQDYMMRHSLNRYDYSYYQGSVGWMGLVRLGRFYVGVLLSYACFCVCDWVCVRACVCTRDYEEMCRFCLCWSCRRLACTHACSDVGQSLCRQPLVELVWNQLGFVTVVVLVGLANRSMTCNVCPLACQETTLISWCLFLLYSIFHRLTDHDWYVS